MESGSESAFSKITDSVRLTTYINLFILPGFVLGLALVNRWYHVRTQTWGFILCALGMAILLAAYQLHWPVWIAVAGFMLFELFLNAGPHLMTFIIPPQIYSVAERGSGRDWPRPSANWGPSWESSSSRYCSNGAARGWCWG